MALPSPCHSTLQIAKKKYHHQFYEAKKKSCCHLWNLHRKRGPLCKRGSLIFRSTRKHNHINNTPLSISFPIKCIDLYPPSNRIWFMIPLLKFFHASDFLRFWNHWARLLKKSFFLDSTSPSSKRNLLADLLSKNLLTSHRFPLKWQKQNLKLETKSTKPLKIIIIVTQTYHFCWKQTILFPLLSLTHTWTDKHK